MSEPEPGCPYARHECPRCGDDFMTLRPVGEHLLAAPCDCPRPCAVCGDTFFLQRVDADGYTHAAPCQRAMIDQRVRWIREARLPSRYVGATLTSFEPRNKSAQAARAHALRFAIGFEPGQAGILYYGACGTGKTHLVVSILRYLVIKRGIRVRFEEFGKLLADLRATFSDDDLDSADVMSPLVDVPVLAIDELGKGRGSEWEGQVLDELISRRYNAGRTTLFTSNYFPGAAAEADAPRLVDRVGVRIYSRLQEMCVAQHLVGTDFRARGVT